MSADRYELGSVLGRGGMGVVYEAVAREASGFTRRVVVKKLLDQPGGDPSQAALFLDEARTASRLHHANIVAVLDYGLVDRIPFQVLELVDGLDVGALLRRLSARGAHGIRVDVALYIVTEVAHGLCLAYEVHSDESEEWTVGAPQQGKLKCSYCYKKAPNLWPRHHRGPCQGIHRGTGARIDGIILCD